MKKLSMAIIAAVLILTACSMRSATSPNADEHVSSIASASQASSHVDEQTQKATPAQEGQSTVDACMGMNDIDEACYWRYQYDTTKCSPEKPCSKLVIFFSGGEMNCDDSYQNPSAGYSRVLNGYTSDGYVGVCAGAFLSGTVDATIPLNKEADRINALITDIRHSSVIQSIWDGKDLLFAGISNGASGPVDAMANTTLDDQPTWKGSDTTAACFHDGVYDIPAADRFLMTGSPALLCRGMRNRVICGRYTNTATGCVPVDSTNPEVALDTITQTDPAAFAIKHWKLVECGSALPACAVQGDWVPAAPIQELCSNISADPGHTCTFGSQPNDSHIACMSTADGIANCRDWFDRLQG